MSNRIGLPATGQHNFLSNCNDRYKIQARRVGDTTANAWFDLPEYPIMDAARAKRCVDGMNVHTPAFVYQAVLVKAKRSRNGGAQ